MIDNKAALVSPEFEGQPLAPDPTSESQPGQIANIGYVNKAVDGKASKLDTTLTPIYSQTPTFSEWTFSDVSDGITDIQQPVFYPSPGGEPQWKVSFGYDGETRTPEIYSSDEDATNLAFVYADEGLNLHLTATRTRTDILGYTLGSQDDKPLASEAEAEALRTGKLDKSGGTMTGALAIEDPRSGSLNVPFQLLQNQRHFGISSPALFGDKWIINYGTTGRDNGVFLPTLSAGSYNRTLALTAGEGYAGNLAALDANGNPTDSGKSLEDIQDQIDTESPLLARSYAIPQQSGWTADQGSSNSPIYFRPRYFGMRDGDLFKGIVLRTRSTNRTPFPSGVYMRIKRYSDGQVLGVSDLTVWPDTASTDVVFRFPRAVELTSSGNYYVLDFSATPAGSAVNFGMSAYSLPSGASNPDFYFIRSTIVPIATAQFYSWEELTGADIAVSGTDATKISDALIGKADDTAIATEFNDSSTYAVDEIVMHMGARYRCMTAVAAAGPWTGSDNWVAESV